MRKLSILAAALMLACLGVGSASAAEDDAVPKRKPGAWEIITVARSPA